MRRGLVVLVLVLAIIYGVINYPSIDVYEQLSHTMQEIFPQLTSSNEQTAQDAHTRTESLYLYPDGCSVECLSDVDCIGSCKNAGSCEAYCVPN